VALIDGTARSWTLAGHATSSRPSAGRIPLPETVMLSCSPTRRSWSPTLSANRPPAHRTLRRVGPAAIHLSQRRPYLRQPASL